MLKKVLHKFTTINKLCIVEQLYLENEVVFRYTELSLKKEELKVIKNEVLNDLKELKPLLKVSLPILVLFNGTKVLTKINSQTNNTFETTDFRTTSYSIEDNNYTCILRSEDSENLIQFLKEEKKLIIDIVIGAFNILKYKDAIPNLGSDYSPHNFNTENNKASYSFNKENSLPSYFFIGDKRINTSFLSSVCSGLDYFINTQNLVSEDETIQFDRNESAFLKILPTITIAILGILFLILGINYLYLNNLNNKYQDSEYKLELVNSKNNEINKLTKELTKKRKILSQFGISSTNQLHSYLDIIGTLVPKEIIINRLNISPITKELKNDKKIQLDSKTIQVIGEVDKLENLNTFIKKIENNSLFESVKIVKFEHIKNIAVFEIAVTI